MRHPPLVFHNAKVSQTQMHLDLMRNKFIISLRLRVHYSSSKIKSIQYIACLATTDATRCSSREKIYQELA